MIDKISAVTVKKIRKTPSILFSAQQSATQNKNKKIKSITSATSVTTASALEKQNKKNNNLVFDQSALYYSIRQTREGEIIIIIK